MKNPTTSKKVTPKPARSVNAARVDRQLEALKPKSAKVVVEEPSSKTPAPKSETGEPKVKAVASADDKSLARVTELRAKFLALHKSKGTPKFREGGRNEPRYNAVVKLEPAELVKSKEFTGAADVLGFLRWIIARQEA